MKSTHASNFRDKLLAEFLNCSPSEQVVQIRKLPGIAEKVAVVRNILFVHKLHNTIKLLSPHIISLSLDIKEDRDDFVQEVMRQSYFPKIWAVMKDKILPDSNYESIALVLLSEALNEKLSQIAPLWGDVEQIFKVFDDDGACARRYNLPSEDEVADKKAYAILDGYEKRRDNNFATKWIVGLFESVSSSTKAQLITSIKSVASARKLLGLLMTYYSPAEKHSLFYEMVFETIHPETDSIDEGFFPAFKEAVVRHKTSPAVVGEFLSIFKGYRNAFEQLTHGLPFVLLQQVLKLSPSLKKHLTNDLTILLKKDLGVVDARLMVNSGADLPRGAVRKIKAFPQEKKLQLLIPG